MKEFISIAAGGTDGKSRFREQEVSHPFTHNFNSSSKMKRRWESVREEREGA